MTSLSDGLGPQKDPNSARTRVQSGPAGTHRPTPGRRRPIVRADPLLVVTDGGDRRPARSRGLAASLTAGSLPRVPGAPRVRAGPSHRHARRAAGDRGPWVSL